MIRKFVLTIIICTAFINSIGQQTAQKFVTETNYLLSLPGNYKNDTTTKWPLLLFLHGGGEGGTDIQKVKAHGPPKLAEQGKKFPFIIVSPQSDFPGGWDDEHLYRLLQSVKKNYRIDDQRVYMTGLSMGGYGTWSLAMKHPDEFAAIAPVCGGGDTADAWKLRNIAVWCFHGAKDDVVPPTASENMVKATRRYNLSVKFTLYPDANHNSWDVTYSNDSLYHWMLSQRKFNYKEITVGTSVLKKFEGRYVGTDKDTVQIIATATGLIAKPGNQTVPLKYAGENVFFIEADRSMDIRFSGNNNMITSFWFLGDRKTLFRKIKK